MKIKSVRWFGLDDCGDRSYDLGLFVAGFEERSTYLADRLKVIHFNQRALIGFEEKRERDDTRRNRRLMEEILDTDVQEFSIRDWHRVVDILEGGASERSDVKVAIDYSSMPRTWYAQILNWGRYQTRYSNVDIDFYYAEGKYDIGAEKPMVIQRISAIPGFEGLQSAKTNSALIVGVGFEGAATLCVLDRLEPSEVYAVCAYPGSDREALKYSIKQNEEFLNHGTDYVFRFGINEVPKMLGTLSELIRDKRENSKITMVPMGPKPHVLGSLILGILFPEVSCLYVEGRGDQFHPVSATGQVDGLSVKFVQ